MAPNPTATERQIQRDGRIIGFLMKAVARVHMPDHIVVDPDRPTLAAGNHQSLLDVFLAASFCHRTQVSCRFLVQARYFENKLAGRWLRRIGCIPLSSETKEEAFEEVFAALKRGELVGIMPEGRLTKPEERNPQVGPFRSGVAEIAREADAIVRPITFHQSGLAWPRGKWPKVRLRNRPHVTMSLGDPIALTGGNDQENAKIIEGSLTAALDRLDAELATYDRPQRRLG